MSDRARQTDAEFARMLARWADLPPWERPLVEAEIREVFQDDLAVLVLDMSGFSDTVLRHGITHFLAKIHEMRSLAVPAVQRHGGEVVKFIADDVLAVFPTTVAALTAATEIVAATRTDDLERSQDMQFEVAIGIGCGPVLHVPGVDLWGDEVNRAFKLGEDTAGPGEIWLTRCAHDALGGRGPEFERIDVSVSGLSLEAYRVRPE